MVQLFYGTFVTERAHEGTVPLVFYDEDIKVNSDLDHSRVFLLRQDVI